MSSDIKHKAPFDLKNQNSFFGSWPVLKDDADGYSIVITFPIEGWEDSASVVVTQDKNGRLSAKAHGTKNSDKAVKQALATLSLDIDDSKWEQVGKRDQLIAKLQAKYNFLRPVLFHSPYEAAAGFVIGQRISIKQRQALQKRMAEELGDKIKIGNQEFAAFPRPQALLELTKYKSLSSSKIDRLHGIAQAALDGKLDRTKLLAQEPAEAVAQLENLNGIGPFYASGILYRGAGIVDGLTDDWLTKYTFQQAYSLPNEPTQNEIEIIAQPWKPYRMWGEVLLHVWLHREGKMPRKSFK